MKYSNIVRFQVKEGCLDTVMSILSNGLNLDGLQHHYVVQTGDHSLCAVGIWKSEQHIANARPQMIQVLDELRDQLVTISEDLGVTDPVSGPVIHEQSS